MIRREFFLLIFLLPILVRAQFSDDFLDGNFTSEPEWIGDTQKFSIYEGMLRLTDHEAGQAALATVSRLAMETQWEFWVRLALTPTDNNHPKIYLISDSPYLKETVNGYFIQIGKNGGDNKRLFLFRQDGDETVELLAGIDNLAASTNNQIRVRVTRDSQGLWEIMADGSGAFLFLPQGSIFDATYTTTEWFGLVCNYTVSNSNRFYFDDFVVRERVPDLEPPAVTRVEVLSGNQLLLHFSEAVDLKTAEHTENYHVDHGIGCPLIAARDPQQPSLVNLIFTHNFLENFQYGLHIQEIKDIAGNTIEACSIPFVFYVACRFDVVFNELMVDPTPSIGQPPCEYIELFNNTGFTIPLQGWILQYGNSRRSLPQVFIEPNGFILLISENAAQFLDLFDNAIVVPGLSSGALTNTGNSLLLFDPDEYLIAFVNYDDTWYGQPAKSQGGWSLEKIDPLNFCEGKENWIASIDPSGGTPCRINSVFESNPDQKPPDLLRAGFLSRDTICLFFSEPMDEGSLMLIPKAGDFGLGNISAVFSQLPDFSSALLVLEIPLNPGIIYEFSLPAFMADCAGNPIDKKNARVAVPEKIMPFDVVINEVLFNPPSGGSRYVEIYNRSDKVVDLKDLFVCSKDTIQDFFTQLCAISSVSYLLFPEDYAVLTTNSEAVKKTFMTCRPNAFIELKSLLPMNNTSGVLALTTKSLEQIDLFAYHEDMHFAILNSFKGVALERINFNLPASNRSNWHSAANSVGFGTPGYRNSQFHAILNSEEGEVIVSPEVFSPDNDGHDDILGIFYRFEKTGLVGSVRIFDSRGRSVRNLVQSELLATEGVFNWDGTTDECLKAPIGIYLIQFEIMGLDGYVQRFRKTAVLAGRK